MKRSFLPCAFSLVLLLLASGCTRDREATQSGIRLPQRDDFARCQADSFRLDLLGVLDALPTDTPGAQQEQLRDWIWTALASRLAAGPGGAELLAGTARQPLGRDEAFSHLLDLPVGRSRSGTGKGGIVYILVDRSSPARIYEDVLEAIDQESLALGQVPPRVVIYGLDLRLDRGEARLCQVGAVDRAWLESEAQGFRRMRLAEAADLQRFLRGGVDLLSASLTDDGALEVAGRRRARAAGAPVTVEHVAAVASAGRRAGEDLGFSLDPRTDVPAVAARLDQLLEAAGDGARTARLLRGWGAPVDEAIEMAALLRRDSGVTRSSLETVREALHGDRERAAAVLAEAGHFENDPLFASLISRAVQHSGYQCARYDGPLQGTRAAMTMFYTDLVAKLWAIDWQSCSPTGTVPGFVSIPRQRISLAYCGRDDGVPYTRIWFGARPEGFLRDAASALRFAPVATRLFALGSALGSDHSEEVEPAANMLRFIRWWDRNYAGVADWEPQYELLNQLMKWTLVRRMVESSGSPALRFLALVEVDRSQELESWLSEQRRLRLQKPLRFAKRADETTECLRLFESAGYPSCGKTARLSGGVSLPRIEDFTERPLRSLGTEPFVRHIDPEASVEKTGDGWLMPVVTRERGEIRNLRLQMAENRVEATGDIASRIPFRGDRGFFGGPGAGTTPVRVLGFRKRYTFTPDGRSARVDQEIGGYGWEQLVLDGEKLSVQPQAGRQAERLAHGLSQLTARGESLTSAALSAAADLPVFTLQDHRVAIELRSPEDDLPVYAVFDGGDGIRGPPPGGIHFTAGLPDPGDGGGAQGPRRGIDVVLLRGEGARVYLDSEKARPAEEANDTVRAVRARLSANDFDGALALARNPEAPPRAVAALAIAAAHRKDIQNLEILAPRLIRHPAEIVPLEQVLQALTVLDVELVRAEDKEPSKRVQKLLLELAASTAPLSPQEARWVLDSAKSAPRFFFAPPGFAGKTLPPVSHPVGKPLATNEKFLAVAIDLMVRVPDAPARLQMASSSRPAEKRELVRVDRPPEAELPAPIPIESGVPWRVVSGGGLNLGHGGDDGDGEDGEVLGVWPLIIVVVCTTDEEEGGWSSLPSCYGPAGSDSESKTDLVIAAACDRDLNGRVDTEVEVSCREELSEMAAAQPKMAA